MSTHATTATSATEPSVARWQSGYEIPVNVRRETVTPPDGDPYEQWAYERVVVSSLSSMDIASAVLADFDGDPAVLAQAQEAALDALAPQVTALTDAVDVLIIDSLGG